MAAARLDHEIRSARHEEVHKASVFGARIAAILKTDAGTAATTAVAYSIAAADVREYGITKGVNPLAGGSAYRPAGTWSAALAPPAAPSRAGHGIRAPVR